MEPLTIAGALLGAFLNKVLPELFLTIMLVILLSFTAYTTLKQAVKMFKAETRKLREQGYKPDGTKESELTKMEIQDSTETTNQSSDELLKNMELQEGESPGSTDVHVTAQWKINQKLKQELDEILESERVVPSQNITILIVMFVVVIAINILKGGGAFPSPLGIQCGSTGFWLSTFGMLVWIVAVSAYVRTFLVTKWEAKRRVGYKYLEGDIQWTPSATVKYPIICMTAGFFAGMFGVGTYNKRRDVLGDPIEPDRVMSMLTSFRPFCMLLYRGWHREGSPHASNAGPSSSRISLLCLYDIVY